MRKVIALLLSISQISAFAQMKDLGKGINYSIEASGTVSNGDNAPLWLSSNRQGLGSVESNSAYERVSITRSMSADSVKNWKSEYGIDLVLNQNSTSNFLIHQAYFSTAYKKVSLTIGAKENEIDLRNNELTSGGLSLGINATPIPQVKFNVDYISVPGTHQWWKFKGRMSYGKTTDGKWQESWVDKNTRYTTNHLYHEKALYMKFGDEKCFPLTYEIGIQMFSQFGGRSYNITGRNIHNKTTLNHSESLNAYWKAFFPINSGGDATDGTITNVAGNHLGSYNSALTWKGKGWSTRLYAERFFEDHSMMTVQYGIYDHLLGIDAELPKNRVVSHALIEHLSSKDQSGAVYLDPTHNMPKGYAGNDDYYNHRIYSGWEHWGVAIGNPLFNSPIYNIDHTLVFKSNRLLAWHIGLDGDPTNEIHWRMLLSFTENWGTYDNPFDDVKKQNSCLFEVSYNPTKMEDWTFKAAFGYDNGTLRGNSAGGQLSIKKCGFLTK